MEQLILHLVGDYVTQSHWMANEKTKSSTAAGAHAAVYALPFLLLASWPAFAMIIGTHFLIDRFRLARYVCWAKNWLAPVRVFDLPDTGFTVLDRDGGVAERRFEQVSARVLPWRYCSATGYPLDTSPWLAVWLMIAADNTLHLAINYAALRWL